MNKKLNKPKCNICNSFLTRNCFFSTGLCCNLKLEGSVPKKVINKQEHLEFLNCINKLTRHPMFESWTNKDPE